MADTVSCPLCGGQHPTRYCDVLLTPFPDPEAPPSPPQEPEPEPSGVAVTCPACGMAGWAGRECDQCGTPLASPSTGQAATATLVLPAGGAVSVPRGREILIGRHSDVAGIRHGLEPYDVVSRRHCYVTVSTTRDEITVRDPGSANGTWTGDDPVEIRPDERRPVALPARIRLGQETYITITAGEA